MKLIKQVTIKTKLGELFSPQDTYRIQVISTESTDREKYYSVVLNKKDEIVFETEKHYSIEVILIKAYEYFIKKDCTL